MTTAKPVSKSILIEDLKRVYGVYGRISRKLYRQYGKHSGRQFEKAFGGFGQAVSEAGLLGNTPSTTDSVVENNEYAGDKWTAIAKSKERIDTLEKLIAHFKVDTTVWSVERYTCNSWEMGYKDNKGSANTQPLYQVKAIFVKNRAVVDAKQEIESLRKSADSVARIPSPIIRSSTDSGNMLEVSLNDAHFGKLAWNRETLGPDYDTKIAQRIFLESVEHLLDRAKGFNFDSILFVVGNDLIHSDSPSGTTTRGTVVDCDTRYFKTFEVVRETITKCIERFRQIAPVVVKMVQGNHDSNSVWHLGDSLSSFFRHYDDVTIDNEPAYRKYYQWGKCGLLMTHGDKGKRADFPLLFATERPDIFGTTKFREVHTGHLHQTRTEEFHGIRVRIIPSLSAADEWHSSNGFTGNLRVAEAYVWNKDQGLIAQVYHTELD